MVAPEALRTVFECFDIDNSGGIDLIEMQTAMKVLGIPCTDQKVKDMFKEADADHSGEIDFKEFCQVVERGDGGALARLIEKVASDQRVRVTMRERCRPIRNDLSTVPASARTAYYTEQLDRLHQERQWMSGLHMTSAREIDKAKRSGYTNDDATYINLDKKDSPAGQRAVPSPNRVEEMLLPSGRATRRMMPDVVPPPSASIAPSSKMSLGLRRIFHEDASVAGNSLQASPRGRRSGGGSPSPFMGSPSKGSPFNSPMGRRASNNHSPMLHSPREDAPWDSPRTASVPAHRPPGGVVQPSFFGAQNNVEPTPSVAHF